MENKAESKIKQPRVALSSLLANSLIELQLSDERVWHRLPVDLDQESTLATYRESYRFQLTQEGCKLYIQIKEGQTQRPRAQKKSQDKPLLETALLRHHGYEKKRINWELATQKDLQKILSWPQSKISRVMKTLFGNKPMQVYTVYKQLCKAKTIKGFLRKCDNGSYAPEAIDTPLRLLNPRNIHIHIHFHHQT